MKTTIEPFKRVLRTVIVLALAVATFIPYVVAGVHFHSDQITLVLGQVAGASVALTAFFATPAGNAVMGWIGLSATAVTKVKADATDVAAASTPVVQAGIDVAENPSLESAETAANVAVENGPAVVDATNAVIGDVLSAQADV